MRLFVKVTPLKVGTSEASAEGELLQCPADVEPDTLLAFLSQRFGDVVETAWTSTERHARLACGWIFAGTSKQAGQEILCTPLVATDDGSLRSMFELLADRRVEFDELASGGEVDSYTVIAVPHRPYRPALVDDADDELHEQAPRPGPLAKADMSAGPGGSSTQSSARSVSTGGGHRHAAGRAGTTEFPAEWSDDQVAANILSVARDPGLVPVWQPNQRWRIRGVRGGVEIVVLVRRDGLILTAWPLPGGRGVQQNPSWSMSPEEAHLPRAMKDLPGRFGNRVDADDVDALCTMAEAGEWAEEIDLLIATLAARQQPVTHQERHDLRSLLDLLEMPVGQLDQVPAAGS